MMKKPTDPTDSTDPHEDPTSEHEKKVLAFPLSLEARRAAAGRESLRHVLLEDLPQRGFAFLHDRFIGALNWSTMPRHFKQLLIASKYDGTLVSFKGTICRPTQAEALMTFTTLLVSIKLDEQPRLSELARLDLDELYEQCMLLALERRSDPEFAIPMP